MQERRNTGGLQGMMREQMQLGFAAIKERDNDQARNIFSTLLEANPELALAHVGLGRVFAAEGDPHKALEHFEVALTIQPGFGPALLFSAEAHENLGDSETALAEYEEAVIADPTLGLAYLRMARILQNDGRGAEALDMLREAARHNPQDVSVRLMLANALGRSGAQSESAQEYARVIDLKPDLWVAHYQVGRAHLQAQNFAAARDALIRAAELAPEQAAVRQALGAALSGLGEHGDAAQIYDEAHRINPGNMRAAVKAAQARSETGQHREAIDLLLGLGRMGRRSGLVQKTLGDIYLAMDRPADAVDAYRALVLNAPALRENASDVQELLQDGPQGSDPADIADFARQLHDVIGRHAAVFSEKIRANPNLVRDRKTARRDRIAG